jgi:Holliday junction DNA helicase RuvA
MIASLRGKLRRKLEDRVVIETAGVGYEVFVPPVVLRRIAELPAGESDGAADLSLVIYYHANRDQPRPLLIGFLHELEKEFFEKLLTVKDIGPMAAARSLVCPIGEMAEAIARQDEKFLRRLPGIGPQKSRNIVAQLQSKVSKFALLNEGSTAPIEPVPKDEAEDLKGMVWEVLVKQLGHRPSEAAQLIEEAFKRNPAIETPEALFDEIYRGRKVDVRSQISDVS